MSEAPLDWSATITLLGGLAIAIVTQWLINRGKRDESKRAAKTSADATEAETGEAREARLANTADSLIAKLETRIERMEKASREQEERIDRLQKAFDDLNDEHRTALAEHRSILDAVERVFLALFRQWPHGHKPTLNRADVLLIKTRLPPDWVPELQENS